MELRETGADPRPGFFMTRDYFCSFAEASPLSFLSSDFGDKMYFRSSFEVLLFGGGVVSLKIGLK
jgi:hypothetical protein